MSKLHAEGGEIVAKNTFNVDRMNVIFTRKAISTTGDLGRIELTVGDGKVEMTFAQGLSLVHEIMRRC